MDSGCVLKKNEYFFAMIKNIDFISISLFLLHLQNMNLPGEVTAELLMRYILNPRYTLHAAEQNVAGWEACPN